MKFRVIVSDPCWSFKDKLRQSSVKRGAESQYKVLKDSDIVKLNVKSLAADDAVLALWVPSSKLSVGMECMNAWGFEQKQTWIWVKIKKQVFKNIAKPIQEIYNAHKEVYLHSKESVRVKRAVGLLHPEYMNTLLDFGMGRLFRQTHELVLVGTKGKIYPHLKNKSQRSVYFWPVGEHSEKPDGLQDMLDIMFPKTKRLEMFSRRVRKGWVTIGNECPSSFGEDIRDSITRLISLK